MIKITFIINSLGKGGTERFFLNLINNLNKNKYTISIVLIKEKGDYYDFLNKDVKVIELKCNNLKLSPLKIRKTLKNENPNIVFSGLNNVNTILGLIAPFLPQNIKMIARESIVLSCSPSIKGKIIIKKLLKIAYKNFDSIIAQSDDMLNDLIKNFGVLKEKSIKINNPIDVSNIENNLNEIKKVEFQKKNYNILCVGRLSYQKGFDLLINALKFIKNENVIIYIMGEGVEEKNLKNLVKNLNLEKRVVFLGRKSNPYIYMKKADLFILSSRYEGFPNVLLEANACGTYALVNNCPGGINEIIEEGLNGSVVDFNDSKLVARKIEELVNKKHDRETIKNYIISKYHVEKIIQQYETLFDEIIEGIN